MKIAYLSNCFPAPSETFVVNEIVAVQACGIEVFPVALYTSPACQERLVTRVLHGTHLLDGADLWREFPRSPHFAASTVLAKEFGLSERFAAYAAKAAEYCGERRVEHLHAHFAADPALVAMLASKLVGVSFSLTAHAYDLFIDNEPASPGEGRSARLASFARSASRIITVSEFNRRFLLASIGEEFTGNVEVVHCGVDPASFPLVARTARECVTFLSVGRFVEKKGHRPLVCAFGNIVDLIGDARLRLVGDGPLRPEIMDLCDRMGLRDRVDFLGAASSETVAEELRRADVFVLHSITAANGDREGVPVAIMEAAATGLPVVSTRHAGIPELVLDGVTGYLVEEGDTVAFSRRMLELAQDPGLRARLGEAGSQHVRERYDLGTEAAKLAAIFAVARREAAAPATREVRPLAEKAGHEIAYWRARVAEEGVLANGHYEHFFTAHFGLGREFYRGKRVADIGCGPRGSLEWADMATRRMGVDPLADLYRELGTARHRMEYLAAPSESIPLPRGYCDVVTSFNSLDHVDDIDATVSEIKRILKPGGTFLLITDVDHEPTPCEPLCFSWDIVRKFTDQLTLVEERRYERCAGGIYDSIKAGVPYDEADSRTRSGVLTARFVNNVPEARTGAPVGPAGTERPRVSVIICTYNRADLLADSVRAALRQDFPPELCEIIVVDNHSRDDTRSVVEALAAAHPGRVKYVFEGRQGLSFARNTGISSAAGEVLVFTDDDIDAEVSWLRELVATFDDEGVACAGGPIRPVWPHAKPAWLTDHWLGYYSVSEFPRARELGAFAGPDYPWGANIAFRAEALRSAGMFPTHLGRIGQCLLSNEEINLCRALEARGSRIAFAPEAVIHHKIAPQRLRKTWLMHRVYWQGRSEAILDLSMGVNIHRRLESSLMTLLSIAADPSLSVFDRRCLERSVFGYLQQALETLQERGPTGSLGRLRVMKALANKVGRDLVRAREDLERLGLQVEQGAQSAVALQQAVRERDERLSQLTGSISWRMTKPLRWAYDRFKKPGSVA